ncbi:MAG: hypothetical protein HQL76_17845 [Magnetococcales bacterium]|nr:hypothetical protein [Magnetococcales bacterium]
MEHITPHPMNHPVSNPSLQLQLLRELGQDTRNLTRFIEHPEETMRHRGIWLDQEILFLFANKVFLDDRFVGSVNGPLAASEKKGFMSSVSHAFNSAVDSASSSVADVATSASDAVASSAIALAESAESAETTIASEAASTEAMEASDTVADAASMAIEAATAYNSATDVADAVSSTV